MRIQDIISLLEKTAPLPLQEEYDNAGLITGKGDWICTGALVCLDATPDVIREAIAKKCNLVIAHHPIVFKGLKKINGKNYVEQAMIEAIKQDVAIYAIHTNLDNVLPGVNGKIAQILGLQDCSILAPKGRLLKKLVVYVPVAHKETLLNALFRAGAGQLGRYDECSFSMEGQGSFRANEQAQPFVGKKGERHLETESRVEVIFPQWLQQRLLDTMRQHHPYEEVAYEIYSTDNQHVEAGSGLIGVLPAPMEATDLLQFISNQFSVPVIKHTELINRKIERVALCGGAGVFLLPAAKAARADMFITADVKYHEFFDAEQDIILADIGHYESEQYTIDLLTDILTQNFPTFAVRKTEVNTNPVRYFKG